MDRHVPLDWEGKMYSPRYMLCTIHIGPSSVNAVWPALRGSNPWFPPKVNYELTDSHSMGLYLVLLGSQNMLFIRSSKI